MVVQTNCPMSGVTLEVSGINQKTVISNSRSFSIMLSFQKDMFVMLLWDHSNEPPHLGHC